MAFTEYDVLMLSSVLKSDSAIQVNIRIMRVFAKLREALSAYKDLKQKIEKMEEKYDQRFQIIFETLDHMLVVESNPKKKIGFTVKEKIRGYGRKRQCCSC